MLPVEKEGGLFNSAYKRHLEKDSRKVQLEDRAFQHPYIPQDIWQTGRGTGRR